MTLIFDTHSILAWFRHPVHSLFSSLLLKGWIVRTVKGLDDSDTYLCKKKYYAMETVNIKWIFIDFTKCLHKATTCIRQTSIATVYTFGANLVLPVHTTFVVMNIPIKHVQLAIKRSIQWLLLYIAFIYRRNSIQNGSISISWTKHDENKHSVATSHNTLQHLQ